MNAGIITDCLSVLIGGLIGSLVKDHLSESFKQQINKVLGLASMGMGVAAICLMEKMPAVIFACTLGRSVCLIAVPQLIIFELLYFMAGVIFPLTTPSMINDFKACGGFIMLATGFRMTKLLDFPIADMIPAMILVMPFSALWHRLF